MVNALVILVGSQVSQADLVTLVMLDFMVKLALHVLNVAMVFVVMA